jgi:hypothetical protein
MACTNRVNLLPQFQPRFSRVKVAGVRQIHGMAASAPLLLSYARMAACGFIRRVDAGQSVGLIS